MHPGIDSSGTEESVTLEACDKVTLEKVLWQFAWT